MTGAPIDSFREIASTLTPTSVSQYLASNDWTMQSRTDDRELWLLPGEAGPHGRVMLPRATDYADFAERFRDTLHSLGVIYGWDASELAERIVAARADMLFVRLDQEMVDGTIPLRQGELTLEALFKLMKAAATTAEDPLHSHRGRRSSTITRFLEGEMRLGQTRRGSFVFTVVTRLGDEIPNHDALIEPPINFPRQVMTTLARGLQSTQRLASSWDEQVLANPGEVGLSANLVESIIEMTEPEQLRALDLSFEWAAAMPQTADLPARIRMDRNMTVGLPRLRERLVRREQPPRNVTLSGTVRSLERDEDGDEESNTIVLTTLVDDQRRRVHIPLASDDYNTAVAAHRDKKPIIVTGQLVFERQAWRLTGDVTLSQVSTLDPNP